MPCYVIVEIRQTTDPGAMQDYIAGAPATVAACGGRYVMRGVVPVTLEGEPGGERMSVIEFPSAADARRWYDSPEYAALAAVRQSGSRGRFLILEGDPPA